MSSGNVLFCGGGQLEGLLRSGCFLVIGSTVRVLKGTVCLFV